VKKRCLGENLYKAHLECAAVAERTKLHTNVYEYKREAIPGVS